METMTLSRDGQRPIQFEGRLLAKSAGQWVRGKDQNRWYNLAVYQAVDGRIVVHWHYRTIWQGETDHAQVEIFRSIDAVAAALERFDPCAWVQGYRQIVASRPRDEVYAARQESLEAGIQERYAAQVEELYEALEITVSLPPIHPATDWEIRYDEGIRELLILGPGDCEIVIRDFQPAKVERGPIFDREILGDLEQLRWAYPILEPITPDDPGVALELISTRDPAAQDVSGLHVLHVGPVCWHLDRTTALMLHAIPGLSPAQAKTLLNWGGGSGGEE